MSEETKKKQRKLISKILPRRENRAFGSIEVYPKKIRFQTQNPGESVYILARAHVLTNIGWIIRSIFLSLIPILILSFLDYFNVDFGFFTYQYVVLLVIAYYISITAVAIMNLASWYYNIYLVTSERIIHYYFKALSLYKVSEAEIENIQDVSQLSVGFLPNLIGYGDILVQTASSRNKFYFRAVSRPVWFRDVIADLARLVRTNEP